MCCWVLIVLTDLALTNAGGKLSNLVGVTDSMLVGFADTLPCAAVGLEVGSSEGDIEGAKVGVNEGGKLGTVVG